MKVRVGSVDSRWVNHARRTARQTLAAADGKASLIYLDPPFGTGKVFYLADPSADDGNGRLAYEDPGMDGARRLADSLNLALECRDAISDNGTVVVHTDTNCGFAFRAAFDQVFGATNFRGEIVVRSGSRDGAPRPHLAGSLTPTHNTLLCYRNRPLPMLPAASGTSEVGDTLWTDIETRGRRTRYPTEKSSDLGRRLIIWLTSPGELVVEPFAGSGSISRTALALQRRVVLGDISEVAAVVSGFGIISDAWEMGLAASVEIPLSESVSWESATGLKISGLLNLDGEGRLMSIAAGGLPPTKPTEDHTCELVGILAASAVRIELGNVWPC